MVTRLHGVVVLKVLAATATSSYYIRHTHNHAETTKQPSRSAQEESGTVKIDMPYRKPRGQDGDRHLLAAAFVHQGSYDDVSVGVHVSLDDARRRVHLFAVDQVRCLRTNMI